MSDGETSIYTRLSHRKAISTLQCVLKDGSDLHANERQKIRHYLARSAEEEEEEEEEEERRMPNRDFLLRAARM